MPELDNPRLAAFTKHHLAWTTLHHFLPAPLLRELAIATLAAAVPEVTLDDLFDEALSGGPAQLATWSLAPKPLSDPDLTFYQQHIRALAWSNDADISHYVSREEEPTPARQISDSVRLGRRDFGARPFQVQGLIFPADASVETLRSALLACLNETRSPEDGNWNEIRSTLCGLAAPLDAAALKHFGDLCADADDWPEAARFYESAEDQLTKAGPEWAEYLGLLSDIVQQSLAAAAWVVDGPAAAADRLGALVRTADAARARRLSVINGSHDALMAALRARDHRDWADLRATVMAPPLLMESFDVGRAVQKALNGRNSDANRHFWSVLRRHTALGSISDAKATKAEYGRALATEPMRSGRREVDPNAFRLGVRLLVEAGLSDVVAHTEFTAATVRHCVDLALINELAETARRYDGAASERALALVELLSRWTAALEIDQAKLAHRLLSEIVALGRGHPAHVEVSGNLGGRCLKVLVERARAQPAFRALIGDQVFDLVEHELVGSGFWTGKVDALKLAIAYRDVWSETQLRAILEIVARQLHEKPSGGDSFIDRTALEFLMTSEAMAAVRSAPALGQRFFADVLRHSLAEHEEGVSTLFNLSAFDRELRLEPDEVAAVQRVVDEVCKRAQTLNSSGAMDAIRALFAAAAHAGPTGVTCAAQSLSAVLRSDRRGSPSFPYAYDPVIDLARHRSRIEAASGMGTSAFQELIDDIGDALATAWRSIMVEPERLAPFSLPPSTTPDPVLVNNFAVATVQYLKTVSDPGTLKAVLEEARMSAAIGEVVYRAVVSGSDDPWTATTGEVLSEEDNDVFYRLLGHRLKQAHDAAPELRRAALRSLLAEVLRRGPREIDLAVFVAVRAEELEADVEPSAFQIYLKALHAKPDVLRLLGPIFHALRSDEDD